MSGDMITLQNSTDDDNLAVIDTTALENNLQTEKISNILVEEKVIPDLRKIVAIAIEHKKDIVIEECLLTNVSLDLVSVNLFINSSNIKGKVNFKDAFFEGQLHLSDLTFEGEWDCRGTIFREEMYVESCSFMKNVNFSNAHFQKRAVFTSCQFGEEADFKNAIFENDVDFSDSIFVRKPTYVSTLFKGEVYLNDSVFKEGMEVVGSNLPEMKRDNSIEELDHDQNHKKRLQRSDISNEIGQALQKKVTRRQLLRGIFRFLPEDEKSK